MHTCIHTYTYKQAKKTDFTVDLGLAKAHPNYIPSYNVCANTYY